MCYPTDLCKRGCFQPKSKGQGIILRVKRDLWGSLELVWYCTVLYCTGHHWIELGRGSECKLVSSACDEDNLIWCCCHRERLSWAHAPRGMSKDCSQDGSLTGVYKGKSPSWSDHQHCHGYHGQRSCSIRKPLKNKEFWPHILKYFVHFRRRGNYKQKYSVSLDHMKMGLMDLPATLVYFCSIFLCQQ